MESSRDGNDSLNLNRSGNYDQDTPTKKLLEMSNIISTFANILDREKEELQLLNEDLKQENINLINENQR